MVSTAQPSPLATLTIIIPACHNGVLVLQMRKVPLKIGIRLDPPALVYIYREGGGLRMRLMPLRNIWPSSDTAFVIEELRNRHRDHIQEVPDFALRKMINILKKTKEGKGLEQAVREVKNGTVNDDDVFERLKRNVKTQETSDKQEKKKEPPKKITFGTNLYDELRLAESKMTPTKSPSSNFEFPDHSLRPKTLQLNNMESITSFNSPILQEKKPKQSKNSFLADLEKDLEGLDLDDKKDTNLGNGKLLARKALFNNKDTKNDNIYEKKKVNDDDTDVEFADSDNPLDDQDEDFW